MLGHNFKTLPGGGTAIPIRLSWPEVAVILLAVGLTIFLNVRGTPILTAVAVSAASMLVFVGIVTIPRGVGEITRNLRLLKQAAEDQSHRLDRS